MPLEYHHRVLADCDPETLYRILWLRVRVFVVEQNAAYEDLDGRDLEPGAELLWAEEDGQVLSTVRILREPGALRIGRVATAVAARSRGVASELMRRALERCTELDAGAPILLDAQAHLVPWYSRFGFEVSGERYLEDGIPHLPMRRSLESLGID
ncbi:GNAT family N-acetyltransferase [Naasia sp. SYSU D00948]|uniref:GNAT family N-acetyltransferase n=1 Tax=Naasia sp. SYSU D00948 TaxID=2817379 RepID=UPI001B30315D|nr:GNAT family N-acetyltransferase [Naasia sp. SYSU D00948]